MVEATEKLDSWLLIFSQLEVNIVQCVGVKHHEAGVLLRLKRNCENNILLSDVVPVPTIYLETNGCRHFTEKLELENI